jgi:class 3 adenylate cyclase
MDTPPAGMFRLTARHPGGRRRRADSADLATAPWPPGAVVRVRIGMHTGEPIRTTEAYTGLDVIRAARIKEAGHGRQVLLSASTAAIVQDALLDDLGL